MIFILLKCDFFVLKHLGHDAGKSSLEKIITFLLLLLLEAKSMLRTDQNIVGEPVSWDTIIGVFVWNDIQEQLHKYLPLGRLWL